MTSNQELKGQRRAMLSALDLKQVRQAVSELRAASPKSVLADLVEEKIRALENDSPSLLFDYAPSQGRRILS
jgi:hypothetical protein